MNILILMFLVYITNSKYCYIFQENRDNFSSYFL